MLARRLAHVENRIPPVVVTIIVINVFAIYILGNHPRACRVFGFIVTSCFYFLVVLLRIAGIAVAGRTGESLIIYFNIIITIGHEIGVDGGFRPAEVVAVRNGRLAVFRSFCGY
ncbi:hypothetical protein D3C86_1721620 [compost metagenome]